MAEEIRTDIQTEQPLEDTVVKVFRNAKVVKGGRRFSFSALVVVGDRNGTVGFGYAKANEVPPAVEKAVKDAIAAAFYAGRKDVTVKDLTTALEETKPISKVMGKKVRALRDKAKGQYRYASTGAEEQSKTHQVKTKKGKKLDLNEAMEGFDEFAKTKKEKHAEAKAKASNRITDILN